MTRDQFIAANRHEWGGMLLDAVSYQGDTSAGKSLWLRTIMQKIDVRIGIMFDQLSKIEAPKTETKPEANGAKGTNASPPGTSNGQASRKQGTADVAGTQRG